MSTDLQPRNAGAAAPAYDPMRLTSAVIAHLLRSGVPVSVRSAHRAFEAAGRLLEALGVEIADGAEVRHLPHLAEVIPLTRTAVRS